MLPWETMTIVAHWETVATMPPSWFIPFMPQWQTISRRTSMTNRVTHSTHDEPFHRCYKWQTISPVLPKTNHCNNVIYEKKKTPVPCCHKKPLQSCHHHKPFHPNYPWQIILPFAIHTTTYFPHSAHEKTLDPCPHDKPLQLCHHQKTFSHTTISSILSWQITSTMPLMTNHFTSSIPENHRSYSTRTNHFTDSIHDTPFIRN